MPEKGVVLQKDRVVYFCEGLYSSGENSVSSADCLRVGFIGYDVVEAHLEDDWVEGRPGEWWDWLLHRALWLLGKVWRPNDVHVSIVRRTENEKAETVREDP